MGRGPTAALALRKADHQRESCCSSKKFKTRLVRERKDTVSADLVWRVPRQAMMAAMAARPPQRPSSAVDQRPSRVSSDGLQAAGSRRLPPPAMTPTPPLRAHGDQPTSKGGSTAPGDMACCGEGARQTAERAAAARTGAPGNATPAAAVPSVTEAAVAARLCDRPEADSADVSGANACRVSDVD